MQFSISRGCSLVDIIQSTKEVEHVIAEVDVISGLTAEETAFLGFKSIYLLFAPARLPCCEPSVPDWGEWFSIAY
jgi:hypothetical protein